MGDRAAGYRYTHLTPTFCKKCRSHFMSIRANNVFCGDWCRRSYNAAAAYRRKVDAKKAADRSTLLQRQDAGTDCCYRGVGPEVQTGKCCEVHSAVPGDRYETG